MQIRERNRVLTGYQYMRPTRIESDHINRNTVYEYMREDGVKGGHRVRHFKSKPLSYAYAYGRDFWDHTQPTTFYTREMPTDWRLLNRVVAAVPPVLPWDKLPSSSRFSLIQFFAELDETLLLFTKKFLKNISYGSFTWGVMPFISDIQAVLETIENLSVDLNDFPFEATSSIEVNLDRLSDDAPDCRLTGSHHIVGRASVPTGAELRILLDRLAFHPDLATAWDLIPLSFVIDYFLPIGDQLQSLVNRGWINQVDFTGWRSLKLFGKGGISAPPRQNISVFYLPPEDNIQIYFRDRIDSSVPVDIYPPNDSEWLQLPSFTQLFNTLYIILSRRK